MVETKPSSKEIDFILHIALSQNNYGVIESVYYKDICSKINISVQKFYDILNSLSQKKLISFEKVNYADVRVKLIGNDCSDERFKVGYLKVAGTDFKNKKFLNMKAGSKLLYLYMQRFIQGKHMLVQNFYSEFCKLFRVVQKSLQVYIHELKENSFLFISKKRNKTYNYEMTMKLSSVLLIKEHFIPREKGFYIDNITDLIKRNFKNRMPEKNPDKVVQDIAELADTKRAEKHSDFVSLIVTAIVNSISKQKQEGTKTPVLNAALINYCLSDAIERSIMEQYGLA
jgi:hypothetical protein